MKCAAQSREQEYYLRVKRILAESTALSTKGAAPPVHHRKRRFACQEFAERLAPVSISVNLVEGTPAFKSPSR